MKLFLTSSPTEGHSEVLSNQNGFVDALKENCNGARKGLYIASYPHWYEFTEKYGYGMKFSLEQAGIRFSSYNLLDGRNDWDAKVLVNNSDLIILAGGHVPTQNNFFKEIKLASLLRGYEGVIIGISAGSMNAASIVYAAPEEEGESIDRRFITFHPGLGLTNIQIIPHYNEEKDTILDGKKLYDDIIAKDSVGHKFYIFNDGTYYYKDENREEIRGECYLIKDKKLSKILEDGETLSF